MQVKHLSKINTENSLILTQYTGPDIYRISYIKQVYIRYFL